VAERGVDVRLLLPGPLGDVAIARHAAHGVYGALLQSGVRIFEYQAATLHAKTMVIDSVASVVGSSNLDFRSFWLNAECNLLCFDALFAEALEHSFAHDLRASVEVSQHDWSTRSMRHRVLDLAARSCRWAL
jgi:cardiolipin synthase